ncbi:hypothetical protein SAMN05892877_10457 [Rhizobium subbaraonis]|uniref:DUF2218 domain-containing protein n=1 Tax=Rhizobium subbaraonis TaxID=908946 RepID=A0A285U5J2_9HYPH|nr:DUF2218 domain-containing protein [Rhizobium subbaraonis]SOC37220.1 hypothetical protein SAMN05892877_10457 [Rhizobium subbaraonis]
MTSSIARIETANASRYLQQLCKHWSHKFPVEFDAATGCVPFGDDRLLRLSAAANQLTMTLEAPGDGANDRLESVVTDHLKRFAFREELVISWEKSG